MDPHSYLNQYPSDINPDYAGYVRESCNEKSTVCYLNWEKEIFPPLINPIAYFNSKIIFLSHNDEWDLVCYLRRYFTDEVKIEVVTYADIILYFDCDMVERFSWLNSNQKCITIFYDDNLIACYFVLCDDCYIPSSFTVNVYIGYRSIPQNFYDIITKKVYNERYVMNLSRLTTFINQEEYERLRDIGVELFSYSYPLENLDNNIYEIYDYNA
jgi:hypothetical protein